MREIGVISEPECNICCSIHEAIIVSQIQGNINNEILEVKSIFGKHGTISYEMQESSKYHEIKGNIS